MRLLLTGPPGCGKGTQGARIATQYDVEHIAAGDILRAEVAAGTPLGHDMASYMRAGELVPDDVILDVVMPRVLAAAEASGARIFSECPVEDVIFHANKCTGITAAGERLAADHVVIAA